MHTGDTESGRVALSMTRARYLICTFLLLAVFTGGCGERAPQIFQGYVEGEFVYVASPLGGKLEVLTVARGQAVRVGAPLFRLESGFETAAVQEASDRLRQAEDRLADLQKGRRTSEIAALEARLRQAQASVQLSEPVYERRQGLYAHGTIAKEDLDKARTQWEADLARVEEITAELETAALGGRTDEIQAAMAEVEATRAKLEQARWNIEQKSQAASREGLVFDTLYETGEWVAAARPVVVLLPPENIKIRFFVPEPIIGTVAVGQTIYVTFDNSNGPIPARITYISPAAEYTPPVIYSSQSRAKLVFMVEARPDLEYAGRFHPGQPVDVDIRRQARGDDAA